MNVQQKTEKWCRNERFVYYANERIGEEFVYAPNHRIDPEHEELDKATTWDNRHIAPMMTYLIYRLQLVRLQKNAKNRNRRVWWMLVHVIMREDYIQLSDGKFEKLLTELHDIVVTTLHDEYTRLSNKKEQRHMVIKHLENKIRLVGIICIAFFAGCTIISVSSIWAARTMVTDAQKKVHVLDGNIPILITCTTMDETPDVEAKSHVEMFHHYFFILAPDDKYIRHTMEKVMYLTDETRLTQHNTLKEKGFYPNVLDTSAAFSIFCGSTSFDKKNTEFTYCGRQRIEHRSNILIRELVTAGQLRRVPRTDNNPYGLLIVNRRTLLNKDTEQKAKSSY